jgi:dynein heavy chain
MQQDAVMTWAPVAHEGEEKPSPRSAHSLVQNGSEAWMFGGCDKRRPPGPNNELYKLDMSDKETFYWMRINAANPPPARWHHTAHLLKDNKTMLVFGGFSADKITRYFNDLWYFDTEEEVWSQPPPAETAVAEGNTVPTLKMPWPGVPTPRGAHATCLVNTSMYLHGGYGGGGFARKDFGDLHSLDLETYVWEELETTGDSPEPRSGHQLLCVEDRVLYLMGGWNSNRQFDDVHVFTLETRAWSQPESASGEENFGPPRWNFTAVSVFAVPFWKIFMFGGNSGDLVDGKPTGVYQNDLQVLECGADVWKRPETVGTIPPPRSDAPMTFESESGTLLMYGGWQHSWPGDCHTCDVLEVVGPPYSVDSISPTIGPVTGNTLCEIKGMGFTSVRGDVTVRFACVKGYEEGTNGSVVDDATLLVETPNYETFGPLDVEIRVAIGSKPLTNSKVSASYFSVTDANQCLAFGPGLVNGVLAGTECQICIQAKDFTGTDRTCGMDEFSIRIEPPPPDDAAKELDEAAILEQSKSADGYNDLYAIEPQVTAEEELKVLVMLSDEGDGTYIAEFEPTVAGEYKVYIEFNGTFDGPAGPIRGSPFTFVAQEAYQYVEAHPKDFTYLEGADPDQRALNEINSFDGPLLIADIVAKIKNIRDFAGKKKRGLAKLDPQNYDDMGPLIEGKEHLRDIARVADEYALCMDSTRACLHYLKARQLPVDRLFDQLGKAWRIGPRCSNLWNPR